MRNVQEIIQTKRSEEQQASEMKGDPGLGTIKQWLANRSYSEKITTTLIWQLLKMECKFEKPDNDIGNRLSKEWEQEVIDASSNIEKLMSDNSDLPESAIAELIAVTTTTATWIPMSV